MCHSMVLVKAARGSDVRFFVVQLLDVVAEAKTGVKGRRGGGWELLNPKPRVRLFEIDIHCDDGDYAYVASTSEGSDLPIEGTINAAAIYGHVSHSSGEIDGSNALVRFEISVDEYERCADIISGKGDAYEESSSGNSESPSEDESSDNSDNDAEGRRVHEVVPLRGAGKRSTKSLDIRALLGKRPIPAGHAKEVKHKN